MESHTREYTVIIPKDGSWQELENTTVIKLKYRKDGSVLMVRIPEEMLISEGNGSLPANPALENTINTV